MCMVMYTKKYWHNDFPQYIDNVLLMRLKGRFDARFTN